MRVKDRLVLGGSITLEVGAIDELAFIQQNFAVSAPAMIVTIYGDIVVPRGGVLRMGTLIEICATFGICSKSSSALA